MLTDEGFTKASGYLDSAQSVAAIGAIKQMHDDGVFTIRDLDGTPDAWDGINSQYAMFFEGPWFPFTDAIVPALIPTVNGKTASVVGGENIVIFSGSTKQDAAFKFVQFMLTPEVQLKLLEVGVIPTLKACVGERRREEQPQVERVHEAAGNRAEPHPHAAGLRRGAAVDGRDDHDLRGRRGRAADP